VRRPLQLALPSRGGSRSRLLRQRDAVAQHHDQHQGYKVSQTVRKVHDNLLPIRRYGWDAQTAIRQSE